MDNILKHLGGIIKRAHVGCGAGAASWHFIMLNLLPQIGAGMIRAQRSIRMTRKRTVAHAAVRPSDARYGDRHRR